MAVSIKIGHVMRHYGVRGLSSSLISLDDADHVILHRQPPNENGVYKPEVTVVLCNTGSLYIGIYVALGEDGKYYTDYDIETPTGGSSGYPSKGRGKARTLSQALRMECEKLKEYRLYQGCKPDKRICAIAEDAIQKINAKCVRLMTIFDILGDETI